MENDYGKILTQKINNFSKKPFYIYIRTFLLDYTVFNFINLGIGIFASFLVITKIKVKETTNLSNKSIIFILIGILTYNIVFGMIGFPIIPLIPNSFSDNILLFF